MQNLTLRQQLALELTKELIAQDVKDPVEKALEYADKIIKADKGKIGFVKD